jgi:hypothetical protein
MKLATLLQCARRPCVHRLVTTPAPSRVYPLWPTASCKMTLATRVAGGVLQYCQCEYDTS